MNYSTNILKYILSPTTTTLARLCFMLFTCFYYSFITRSTWYFCCLSIRFTIYSNWFTMSPCSSFPFYYSFITRSTWYFCCLSIRSTNSLSYILSPTTTTLARVCFMLFTCMS